MSRTAARNSHACRHCKINAACQTEMKQLAKTQTMKGFRKGKVPISVIEQRFGEDVKRSVMQKSMEKFYYMAVVEEKIQPAGVPAFSVVSESENDVVFTATFEVVPEVKLPAFNKLKGVEKWVTTIDDAQSKALNTELGRTLIKRRSPSDDGLCKTQR